MDEVRTERLVETHQDWTLLVMLRDWPVSDDYVNQPELIASLEQQVKPFHSQILPTFYLEKCISEVVRIG